VLCSRGWVPQALNSKEMTMTMVNVTLTRYCLFMTMLLQELLYLGLFIQL
jgi:hypothetical protein